MTIVVGDCIAQDAPKGWNRREPNLGDQHGVAEVERRRSDPWAKSQDLCHGQEAHRAIAGKAKLPAEK